MDEFQLPDLSKPPPSMAGAVPSCILESTTNQRLMMYPHYSRFPGYNEYPMFPGMVLPMAWPPSNVGIGPMQWQEQQQTNQPPAHAAMPMPWHPQFQRQGEIVPQPPAQNAMTPQPPAPPAYAALPWHPQFQRQGEIVPQPPAQNAMTPQPPAPPAYAALPWHPQFQRQEEIVPQNPLTPQTSGVHQSRIFVHQRHKPQRLLQQIPADNMNLRSRVIVTEIEDSESVGQEPAAGTEPRIGLRMNLRSRVAQVTEVQDSVDSSEGEDFEPRRQVAGGAGSSKRQAAAGAAPSGHRKSAATQFRAEEESSMPGPSKQRKRSQVQDSVDTSEGEDFEPRRQVAGGAGSSKRQAAAGAAPSGHRKSAATQSRAEESSMPGPSKQRKRDQLLDPVDDLELELKKKKLSLTQPQKKAKSRSHDTKAAEALEEAFPINRNKAATSKVIGAGKKSGNNKRRKKPEEDEEADVDDPDPVPQNQSSTDDSDEEGHEPPTKQSVANAKFSADEVINISSDEESASGELSQCEERQPLAEQDLSYEAGEDWDWPYPRMLSPEPEERKDFDCCICETVWEAGASAYKGIINCGHDNFCYHCIVAQQVNNHTCPLCYEIITDVKSELVQ